MEDVYESDLRRLTRSLAEEAKELASMLSTNPGLQPAYDSVCDVLDFLNSELIDEGYEPPFFGQIDDTWSYFRYQ